MEKFVLLVLALATLAYAVPNSNSGQATDQSDADLIARLKMLHERAEQLREPSETMPVKERQDQAIDLIMKGLRLINKEKDLTKVSIGLPSPNTSEEEGRLFKILKKFIDTETGLPGKDSIDRDFNGVKLALKLLARAGLLDLVKIGINTAHEE